MTDQPFEASATPVDEGSSTEITDYDDLGESVVDGIDRMRDDGGVAPELPHRRRMQ